MPNLAGPSQKTPAPTNTVPEPIGANPTPPDTANSAISPPAPGAGAIGQAAASPVVPPFTPPVDPKTPPKSNSSGFNKKLIIIPLVILLIAAVSFGGYYYYTNIYSQSQSEETTLEDELDQDRDLGILPASPPPAPTPAPPNNVHVNSTLGFSFKAPEGWEKIEVSADNVSYRNNQLDFDENNQQYQANLNMVTQELQPETTLEEYGVSNQNDRIARFSDYEFLGSANDTFGSNPAIIDDYLVFIDTRAIRQRQVYTIKNDRGYIFTFATLPESWDNHLQTFDNVRSSFTFSGAVSGARIGL